MTAQEDSDKARSFVSSDTETPARPVPGIGDLVRHSTFGEGVVVEWLAASGDHEVTVHFKDGAGIKRLLLSFAPLEIIYAPAPKPMAMRRFEDRTALLTCGIARCWYLLLCCATDSITIYLPQGVSMPKAYGIAHITFINQERWYSEFGSKVEATVQAFGGRPLVRGGEVSYQEGESLGEMHVVIEFPDRSAAHAWLNSEEHQAILPGRKENSTAYFVIVDGLPD